MVRAAKPQLQKDWFESQYLDITKKKQVAHLFLIISYCLFLEQHTSPVPFLLFITPEPLFPELCPSKTNCILEL